MKRSVINISVTPQLLFIFTLLFMLITVVTSLDPHNQRGPFTYNNGKSKPSQDQSRHTYSHKEEEPLHTTGGSSLPDCSHACGSCYPCKRVMVSFKCLISVAEPCPVVYRCMCKGKYYHVPSN